MTRQRLLPITVLVAALLLACGADEAVHDPPGRAEVVRVVDGDTIVVRIAGQRSDERVRLIGIDTPETVDPRSPVECFGEEASARAKELLPPGTAVRLERDVEARDRYERLLAYVYRAADDLFVNLAMVEEGFAAVLTYPPNVAHTEAFVTAAAEARAAGRGLWGACPDP
ncbi:MAG TPA: thermonuclease family protein [Acidimicrobiales bacterium]|nr:thermonuclease family protein [Acidimicrobiales bacterium]